MSTLRLNVKKTKNPSILRYLQVQINFNKKKSYLKKNTYGTPLTKPQTNFNYLKPKKNLNKFLKSFL